MNDKNNIVSDEKDFDYKIYLDLLRDTEYTELYDYYSKETMLDILGVARQENPHSCFLRWLLDTKGKHGYGSMPMRKFLESVCLFRDKVYYDEDNEGYKEYADDRLWQQNNNLLGKKNIDILEEIKYGRYEIINQSIANEVVLEDQRRADIFAVIQLKFQRPVDKVIAGNNAGSDANNNIRNLIVLIENKVLSKEGKGKKEDDKKGQTEQYAKDLSSETVIKGVVKHINKHMPVKWMQDQIDDISRNSLKLYVFLNAFQTSVIKEAWKKQVQPPNGIQEKTDCFAKSEEFITINYQYLLDGMIEPLRRLSSDDIVKHRMQDYIRCLGQSKITSIGEQTAQKDDGEYLIMAVSGREKKIAISLWHKYYKVIYPILESLFFDEISEFLLNENDRDFWTSLSNLYRVIELEKLTGDTETKCNDSGDEYSLYCKKLKELVENANKASRKHKFIFLLDKDRNIKKEYESYTSRSIGLLCRDIIADFVKKLESKNVENVRGKIVKLREEVQGWNLNWLREVILFDEEVEAIQKDSYTPDMAKPQYCTKDISEFSHAFFSYMNVLRKKEKTELSYKKGDNEKDLIQKYLGDQELEIELESGDKVYVAKFWGSDDLIKLIKHIDEKYEKYGFHYQSAVTQKY